jgi:hypothetical protein
LSNLSTDRHRAGGVVGISEECLDPAPKAREHISNVMETVP